MKKSESTAFLCKIKKVLLHSIAPNRCIWCNKVIQFNETACKCCIRKLPEKPLFYKLKSKYPCLSSFPYETPYKNVLTKMKFADRPNLADKMGYYMSLDILNNYDVNGFDYITAVPLNEVMLKRRTYNQAELLAVSISKRLSIPYKSVLIKKYQNKPQHTLSFKERETNVKGIFRITDVKEIKGKNILIIDDTVTSGNTLAECCNLLTKAGAASVSIATFSRSLIKGLKNGNKR